MANWDDLAKRYRADAEQARIKQERQVQKQNKISLESRAMWDSLIRELNLGVRAISSDTQLLVFHLDPMVNANEAAVTYRRPDKSRVATITFNPSSAKFLTRGPGQGTDYLLEVDDDDKVCFGASNKLYSAEALAEKILTDLLNAV